MASHTYSEGWRLPLTLTPRRGATAPAGSRPLGLQPARVARCANCSRESSVTADRSFRIASGMRDLQQPLQRYRWRIAGLLIVVGVATLVLLALLMPEPKRAGKARAGPVAVKVGGGTVHA